MPGLQIRTVTCKNEAKTGSLEVAVEEVYRSAPGEFCGFGFVIRV